MDRGLEVPKCRSVARAAAGGFAPDLSRLPSGLWDIPPEQAAYGSQPVQRWAGDMSRVIPGWPGDRSGQIFAPVRGRIDQWSLRLYSVSVDRGDTNEVAIRVGDHESAPEDVFVRLFDNNGALGRPRGEAVVDSGC